MVVNNIKKAKEVKVKENDIDEIVRLFPNDLNKDTLHTRLLAYAIDKSSKVLLKYGSLISSIVATVSIILEAIR